MRPTSATISRQPLSPCAPTSRSRLPLLTHVTATSSCNCSRLLLFPNPFCCIWASCSSLLLWLLPWPPTSESCPPIFLPDPAFCLRITIEIANNSPNSNYDVPGPTVVIVPEAKELLVCQTKREWEGYDLMSSLMWFYSRVCPWMIPVLMTMDHIERCFRTHWNHPKWWCS